MAEVLLRHRLDALGVGAMVSSAGSYPGGEPATAHGQTVMAARGLDLSGHVSRRLDREMVDSADLIIGMTREHVREAAAVQPAALDRTFTLKELVRAAGVVGERRDGETMAQWLVRAGAGRRRADLVGVGHDDALDIADPVGRGLPDYQATADDIDALLALLVRAAWPSHVLEQERTG